MTRLHYVSLGHDLEHFQVIIDRLCIRIEFCWCASCESMYDILDVIEA